MKIGVPWESKNRKGGGFSFSEAIVKGLLSKDMFEMNWQDADVVLIPSASVITKELFREIKATDKKIVLRVDNALKHSRNRGSGMSRMLEFAKGADMVVYQGEWAQSFLEPFLGTKGTIIHNGIDTDVFNSEGAVVSLPEGKKYLYSCASKGETKQWEWAWWEYQMIQRKDPDAHLVLTGNFPDSVQEWNFNFFMDEKYEYLGMISDRERMAQIYRACDYLIAPYTNDAFSQTYIEALCCGLELYNPNMSGGTPEILELWEEKGYNYFKLSRMLDDYIRLFTSLI